MRASPSRGVTTLKDEPQPRAERLQGEIGQTRGDDFAKRPGVEPLARKRHHADPARLGAEHGEVETDRMADHRPAVEEAEKLRERAPSIGRIAKVTIGDAVNGSRGGGNRRARVDQHREFFRCSRLLLKRHRPDLHKSRGAGIEPSGLDVQHDRIDADERRRAEFLQPR